MKLSSPAFSILAVASVLGSAGASSKHDHASWIRAEQSCTTYEKLMRIHYDVSGEGASDEDWIALLPSDVGSNSHHVRSYIAHANRDNEYMWMSTTGDHETFEAIDESTGGIAFQLHDDDESGDSDSSDIDEDHTQYFRLHMIRGRDTSSSHHMRVLASSAPVKVSRECPVTCQSWVEVTDTVLTQGEDVGLQLDNCEPEKDDFVALVPADLVKDTKSIDPHYPMVWVWACGDRDCREAVETNGVALSTYTPSPPGHYVAVLAKKDGTLKSVSQDEIRIDESTNDDGSKCVDTVKVTSSCLAPDDDFSVEISTCLPPRDGDWVGIYRHHLDPEAGQTTRIEQLAFIYACDELDDDEIEANVGSKFTCTRTVSKNKNAIDEATVYKSEGVAWPLEEGEYQVSLIHDRNGVTQAANAPNLRQSFAIRENCVESTNRRRNFLRRKA